MEPHEFDRWLAQTQRSANMWVEDRITCLNGKGALYYTGGEDGVYIRITPDGTLEAGTYEGAYPHIGEAVFQPVVRREYGSFDIALGKGLEFGGLQFLVNLLSAGPTEDLVYRTDNQTFITDPASPDEVGNSYAQGLDQGMTMGGM